MNEWIINVDNNNDINYFLILSIFSNFQSSRSSIKKINHVLVISHILGKCLLKYFYILVPSPETHCKIILHWFFLNLNFFADVDDFSFVCKMVEIRHNVL
jgi:hypothetical protein